jgi:hypothetical protein
VRDRKIGALPIDPRAIAAVEDIDVHEKPASAGASGMLIRAGNRFAIAYATHISSEGFRRFSIAHELGHYFLPGHTDHVLPADGVHESRAGFSSKDKHEKEADQFAVGLLMPSVLFQPALQEAGDGLAAIEELSNICATSLSATAIRFAELVDGALVAIIVSNQNEVEYCCMSKQFRELSLTWLRREDPVPPRTRTFRFNGDSQRIARAERDAGATRLDEWFRNAPDLGAYEEIVGLGSYGRTLTVLTVDELPDEEERQERDEEEEALIRSWTPTFHRSRRK